MSIGMPTISRSAFGAIVLGISMALAAWSSTAHAQLFQQTRSVGGVMVDATGILDSADPGDRAQLVREVGQALEAVPQGLDRAVATRKISLKRIEAALDEARATGRPLPDAILYLGGLQKIDYVMVVPEDNDIVLIGPGEGWTVGPQGTVVGATSGRAVMLLDDLVVALRSAAAPTKSVISCSIDPTLEGLQRLRAHASTLRAINNPSAKAMETERQLGPQQISVTGVPQTSHFARVMVAADYRMKRISMDLEPSPVPRLPSIMDMLKAKNGRGLSSSLPRWWLAPDYEPLLRDDQGLIWQLRKATVKTMAENDFLDSAGVKHQTGRADPMSQRWADIMTDRYDALAKADPVFGELRNCMDLAVVSALLVRERLLEKADMSLPRLMDPDGVETAELYAPKQVASKASLVHHGRGLTIACGGVQINPWEITAQSEPGLSLATLPSKVSFPENGTWWSN